ncbi:MAG TPA: 50S ribosomal protein L11 methyltransferase, partial [Bacillota bacterium]
MKKDRGNSETLVGNTGKEQEKPGYWLEITITTTPEAAEMVGEILIGYGCGGVVYHDPFVSADAQDGSGVIIPENLIKQDQPYRVSGYLPIRKGLAETVAQIESMLKIVAKELPVGEGKISCREV